MRDKKPNACGADKPPLSKTLLSKALGIFLIAVTLSACSGSGVKLNPADPEVITVWHYYNGQVLTAFESMLDEFNETEGAKSGVIVETYGFGGVAELEQAVQAAAGKEIGSMEMPNIFASYADLAFAMDQKGLLADLSAYFSPAEQSEYHDSYIEEGRIGSEGELRIFPVAKSTEVMLINETGWLPFAAATRHTLEELSTMEGLLAVARDYYEWSEGKTFFGRDSMSNFFIIAVKQLGGELFSVNSGELTLGIDCGILKKLWDYYYVPYISGYFGSFGRFRSDDVKVGDLLAYVGSTSSASYFPSEVTVNSVTHPVTARVLPAPLFADGEKVMVQQGAGMAVTADTPETEYASLLFLKWFSSEENNIGFSVLSGYMPVKTAALDYERIKSRAAEQNIPMDAITDETLRIALLGIAESELYTGKPFSGGVEVRAVLDNHLQDKCEADRAEVLAAIAGGLPHAEAVARYAADDNFESWLADFTGALTAASGQ